MVVRVVCKGIFAPLAAKAFNPKEGRIKRSKTRCGTSMF